MKISNSMKRRVITISETALVRDAVLQFVHNQISMLPVVDADGRPVGVIKLGELLKRVLPSFVDLIEDFDYVGDFGAMENGIPDPTWLKEPVTAVMRPIEFVDDECGLIRAFSLMKKRDLLDLPVVDKDGRLVGLASRVDIGRRLLSNWPVDLQKNELS
jgi:CBS domain-containing protein